MKRTAVTVAVLLVAVSTGACGSSSSPGGTGPSQPAPSETTRPSAGPVPVPVSPASRGSSSRILVASGHGWSASGLDGPEPAPGSCRYRTAADGYYLPDPACTPGAIDPAVTQANLDATLCRAGGYTSSVRPPRRLTDDYKPVAEAAYRDPAASSRTELDHLIPLEVGGASDTRNLWPEPDQGSPGQFDPQDPYGINAKDGVENRLRDAVCAGSVTLAAAQSAIASDWTTALSRLGLRP